MIVVTPLALVLSIEIELSMPDPFSVVPVGRLGHVSHESSKSLGVLTGLAPAGSAVTSAMTKIAGTKASRLIENLLSLPKRVLHPRTQRVSSAESGRFENATGRTCCAGEEQFEPALPSRNDRLGAAGPPRHIEGSRSVRSTFELLIDREEDRTLRAVLVGMPWEIDR
jgi:hypothetical protein